jgi:hypothetical protein
MAWEIMPKVSGGSAPKSYLRLGFDTLAPYAGLPPVGAVDEVCILPSNLISVYFPWEFSYFYEEICNESRSYEDMKGRYTNQVDECYVITLLPLAPIPTNHQV